MNHTYILTELRARQALGRHSHGARRVLTICALALLWLATRG